MYYGTKPGTYQLYDDDGEIFNYEKGAYSFRTITVIRKNNKIAGSITKPEKGKPNSFAEISYKMTTK